MKKLTTQEFIERAKSVHGDKYDYSLVQYQGRRDKVFIICPKHEVFEQNAGQHLSGSECPICARSKMCGRPAESQSSFIKRAKKIHKDKYDYSKVIYKNARAKIFIICKKHGKFHQSPANHISGNGCKRCSMENQKSNTEEFIKKANKIHCNLYDYSKTDYKTAQKKVVIICKKHGEFKQKPNGHLLGQGCSKCRSSKGESVIYNTLKLFKIDFVTQKKFPNCRNKKPLPFDFYIPSKNLLIEYNGEQHYFKHNLFNKGYKFKSLINRDNIKRKWCKENNITLLTIPYIKFKEINKILKNALL